MDDSVKDLGGEVRRLNAELKAVRSCLWKVSKLRQWEESLQEKEIWGAVHAVLTECNGLLDKLAETLDEVEGSEDAEGWLPSTMRAFRLNAARDNLLAYRAQIQGRRAQVRVALTTSSL